jgi:hypothetical protein
LRRSEAMQGALVHAVKSLAIKQEPPAAGASILSWLYRRDSLEALLGDLEEEYQKRAMEQGVSAPKGDDRVNARFSWWAVQVSNLRPSACKADALPLS